MEQKEKIEKEVELSDQEKLDLRPVNQPVIVKQFDIDEALEHPMVQNLIAAGANFLNTNAERNKQAEITQQARVKSQVKVQTLINADKSDERKYRLKLEIINRVHNMLMFIGLFGLFLLLWKLEILNDEAVKLLIPILAVLVASGTDFKSIIGRNKNTNNRTNK